jgi:hypothetical protein
MPASACLLSCLQAATATCLLHNASSARIAAVHADAAVAACEQELVLDAASFPALTPAPAPARPLAGFWAQRNSQQTAAATAALHTLTPSPAACEAPSRPCCCQDDAEDVLPRASLPTTTTGTMCTAPPPHTVSAAYLPPARRAGASATLWAGCRITYPSLEAHLCHCLAPAAVVAPYKPPQRRTAEEQAAAAAAPRPGRPCAFPQLLAGPQPEALACTPSQLPTPRYLMALLGQQ